MLDLFSGAGGLSLGFQSAGFEIRAAVDSTRKHAFAAQHLSFKPAEVMDELMVQKVLVKLRGAGRERPLLTGLRKLLADMPKSQELLAQLLADLDEFGSRRAHMV